MILKRMVLTNFRQFREAEIAFAAGEADSGKNVTVVLGENGRGKTGIYRALMFCLYGDHTLTQDEDVKKEEMYLVNKAAVLDAQQDRKPVLNRAGYCGGSKIPGGADAPRNAVPTRAS
jgi:DNA sulfur modification protein DndD